MLIYIPQMGVGIAAVVVSETMFRPHEAAAHVTDYRPGEGVVVSVDPERPASVGKAWLELTVRVPRGRPRRVRVGPGRPRRATVDVFGRGPLSAAAERAIRDAVGRVLRLDQDLSSFYELLEGDPGVNAIAAQSFADLPEHGGWIIQ